MITTIDKVKLGQAYKIVKSEENDNVLDIKLLQLNKNTKIIFDLDRLLSNLSTLEMEYRNRIAYYKHLSNVSKRFLYDLEEDRHKISRIKRAHLENITNDLKNNVQYLKYDLINRIYFVQIYKLEPIISDRIKKIAKIYNFYKTLIFTNDQKQLISYLFSLSEAKYKEDIVLPTELYNLDYHVIESSLGENGKNHFYLETI